MCVLVPCKNPGRDDALSSTTMSSGMDIVLLYSTMSIVLIFTSLMTFLT